MSSTPLNDFDSWQVPDLKHFLSTKGITCSIYLKRHLIKLCKLAVEINLEDLEVNNNEFGAFDVQRRTVNRVVLPHIKDISADEWLTDLKTLPDIEIGDVMVWLLRVGWDPSRLKLYKQDNGYKLYNSSRVDNVKLHHFENAACFYIKCQTVPETRQQAAPYQTWILVSESGQIQSGGCSCVANDGSCKHCTALLFSLCSFNERHKDRHTLVGTDVLCSWDKPRSASRPEKIQNVQVHNSNSTAENDQHGPCHTVYNPCKGLQNEREIEKKLFDMCKDSNSLLLQTLDPPSDYEDTSEDIQELHEVIKEASLKNISVTSHLQAVFDPETILRIADITKDQSTGICDEWKRHRHGR